MMREAEMIVLFKDRKPGRARGASASPMAERRLFGAASRRKADAIAALADGALTAEEACLRYGLETGELATWQRALDSFGLRPRRKAPKSAE